MRSLVREHLSVTAHPVRHPERSDGSPEQRVDTILQEIPRYARDDE